MNELTCKSGGGYHPAGARPCLARPRGGLDDARRDSLFDLALNPRKHTGNAGQHPTCRRLCGRRSGDGGGGAGRGDGAVMLLPLSCRLLGGSRKHWYSSSNVFCRFFEDHEDGTNHANKSSRLLLLIISRPGSVEVTTSPQTQGGLERRGGSESYAHTPSLSPSTNVHETGRGVGEYLQPAMQRSCKQHTKTNNRTTETSLACRPPLEGKCHR